MCKTNGLEAEAAAVESLYTNGASALNPMNRAGWQGYIRVINPMNRVQIPPSGPILYFLSVFQSFIVPDE